VLELPAHVIDAMVAHAHAAAPAECCGFVVGAAGVATRTIPLRNELASPVAYRADARDLFHAFRLLRDEGLELLAIYHSHPTSPAIPSRVDLAENYYGDLPRIIISLASEPPAIKVFRLHSDGFDEIECTPSRRLDIRNAAR